MLGACFVDECNSLAPKGLRAQTQNLTLDFSVVQPITDPFRFYRNVSDDGFVQYVSTIGFEKIEIVGYAYESDIIDTDWHFELRTGERPGHRLMNVLKVNSSNLRYFKEEWKNTHGVETNWSKFRIFLSHLPRCPKVIELWFRGNASGNSFPGWGLQVGRVKLEESLFNSCMIPPCLNNEPHLCFPSMSSAHDLRVTEDETSSFREVFIATDNIVIESANAISYFSGDAHRFRRMTNDQGIVTYSIPEGIASIEVTFYRCEKNRTAFSVVPYIDPHCKPLQLTPTLKDDSYYSNCWRRYKATIDFMEMLTCPPTFVDLVIEGTQDDSLQISNVVLTGYGPTEQDPEFGEKTDLLSVIGDDEPDKAVEQVEPVELDLALNSESQTNSPQESVKIVHWLPATIVGCIIVFSIFVGVILFRNDNVRDFIADYVEDNFPFIFNHFFPPDPPKPKTRDAGGVQPRSNNRSYASESINFSCTFDNNLKKKREPSAKKDVSQTRDGFGEQLIDLSKSLQKSLWVSKVGKKQRFVEIEERLGRGGFGKVWKARWQGTPVALKVVPLHANLNQEEKQAKMAIMEAALSGCLAHPNIVSTYACEIREANDFDKDNDEPMSVEDSQNKQKWVSIDRFAQTNASKSFMKPQAKNDLEVRIIMEYCDRGSLVAGITQGWFRDQDVPSRPDLDAVILTALDIARGLCCLHENNIIHGDLKPHNVLLQNKPFVDSRGFIAKIADFGLSIKMESEQSHVDGMRMGTGGYVSPEVAVRGKILPASDIYSFGILLWEMFTGELIQDAIKDAPKVSSKLTMGSWRPIFNDDCPQAYSRLACMCWNDFPDWRPTLDYIIDELNDMLKPRETPQPSAEPSPEDLDSTSAPTMTLP